MSQCTYENTKTIIMSVVNCQHYFQDRYHNCDIIRVTKDFHAMYHKDKALTTDCSVDKNTLNLLIKSFTYLEKDRPGDYEP